MSGLTGIYFTIFRNSWVISINCEKMWWIRLQIFNNWTALRCHPHVFYSKYPSAGSTTIPARRLVDYLFSSLFRMKQRDGWNLWWFPPIHPSRHWTVFFFFLLITHCVSLTGCMSHGSVVKLLSFSVPHTKHEVSLVHHSLWKSLLIHPRLLFPTGAHLWITYTSSGTHNRLK